MHRLRSAALPLAAGMICLSAALLPAASRAHRDAMIEVPVPVAAITADLLKVSSGDRMLNLDVEKLLTAPANVRQTSFGPAVKLRGLDMLDMRFIGDGMNTIQATLTNRSPMPVDITFSPGLLFLSPDPAVQDLALIRPATISIPAGMTATRNLFTVCANMRRRPPDAAKPTEYALALPLDMRVPGFCAEMGRPPYGPSRQAQAWIRSDFASREDINVLLTPPVSALGYGHALHAAALTFHEVNTNRDLLGKVSPDLLLDPALKADATRWLVQVKMRDDPQALVRFVERNIANFRNSVGGESPDQALAHLVDVALALSDSNDAAARRAALKLLSEAIPEDQHEKSLTYGVKWAIVRALESEDPDEVRAGLDLAAKLSCPLPAAVLDPLLAAKGGADAGGIRQAAERLTGLREDDAPQMHLTAPTLLITAADPRSTEPLWGTAQHQPFRVQLLVPRDQAMGLPEEVKVEFRAKESGDSAYVVLNNRNSPAKGPVVYTLPQAQVISGAWSSLPGRNRLTTQIPFFDFTKEDFLSELHVKNGDTVTASVTLGGMPVSTSLRVFDTTQKLALEQYRATFAGLQSLYAEAMNTATSNEDRSALTSKLNLVKTAIGYLDYAPRPDERFSDFTKLLLARGYIGLLQQDPKTLRRLASPHAVRPNVLILTLEENELLGNALHESHERWRENALRAFAGFTIEMYRIGVAFTGADQAVIAIWGIDPEGKPVNKTDRFFAGVGLASQLLLVGAAVGRTVQTANAGVQGRMSQLAGLSESERKAILAAEQRAAGEARAGARVARAAATAVSEARAAGAHPVGGGWATAVDRSPDLASLERKAAAGGKPSVEEVMRIKTDPAAMRSLKNAPENVRLAFNEVEESVYRLHDRAVVEHVKGVTMLDGRPAPWAGREVVVQDFRTPGAPPGSINTDRDFRVVYRVPGAEGMPDQWLEVPRKVWNHASTEEFAKASGYSPEKLRALASPEDIRTWDNFAQTPGGPSLDDVMKEKWAELHQQLATDKWHPEASLDFSDQVRNALGQLQQAPANILDVKKGGALLRDAERLGMMYNEKADAYLRLRSALYPEGNKLEAMAQLNKGIDMLRDVRTGYSRLFEAKGAAAPIGTLSDRFNKAADAIKRLAPYDKTITHAQIAALEAELQSLGFRGLPDFKLALDSQFTALKTVPPP